MLIIGALFAALLVCIVIGFNAAFFIGRRVGCKEIRAKLSPQLAALHDAVAHNKQALALRDAYRNVFDADVEDYKGRVIELVAELSQTKTQLLEAQDENTRLKEIDHLRQEVLDKMKSLEAHVQRREDRIARLLSDGARTRARAGSLARVHEALYDNPGTDEEEPAIYLDYNTFKLRKRTKEDS